MNDEMIRDSITVEIAGRRYTWYEPTRREHRNMRADLLRIYGHVMDRVSPETRQVCFRAAEGANIDLRALLARTGELPVWLELVNDGLDFMYKHNPEMAKDREAIDADATDDDVGAALKQIQDYIMRPMTRQPATTGEAQTIPIGSPGSTNS